MAERIACGYAAEGQGVTPLAAAIECGAMAAEGIEATLDKLGTAHRVAEAVADGSIVFGNLAAPGLVDVVAKGAELAMIVGGVNQQFLVGRLGATLENVVGQPLGASRPLDLGHFLLELTMERVLKAPSETIWVEGSRGRVAALLDGTIAASPLSPPVAIEAKHAGLPWLYDYTELGLNFAIGGIAASRTTISDRPELVAAFLRAYLAGQREYKSNRAFGVSVHEKYGETSTVVAEETYDVTSEGFRDVPDPATEGMEMLVSFLREQGKVPSDFTTARVVDSAPILAVCGQR